MRGIRSLAALTLLGSLAIAASSAPVGGKVEALGFPAGSPNGRVVRAGQWFPIRVQLDLQGTGLRTSELRLAGLDLDGDRIDFRSPPVTLSSEGGATQRRVWCYAVANRVTELVGVTLDVIDNEQMQTVARLPLPMCDLLSNDALLVMDISAQRVTALDRLTTPGQVSSGQGSAGLRPYHRDVVLSAGMGARELPDRWWGLEAVDVIVWDLPSPEDLKLTTQVDALVQWVRNGGQLIVGVGASWDAIQSNSTLAEIMPLRGAGRQSELRKLRTLFDRMGLRNADRELKSPIAVTGADLADESIRTLGEFGPGGTIHLVTMRPVGAGRVVAVAGSIRELTGEIGGREERFFGELLDLNAYTAEFKERQLNMPMLSVGTRFLYDDLVAPVGFGTATAVRGLTAFLFVIAYIVLATVASWWWLRRRKLTHLSWVTFAVLAVGASLLSLATVRAMSGFSGGVQSVSFVDMRAGSSVGRGPCWFGYRSPTRRRVDLTLPGEGCFLRPLARCVSQPPSVYVTPARYAGLPARATLEDVLMRATLKQTEGHWEGVVDGMIRANIDVDRGTGRVTPTSWIANDLPLPLEGGYLLYVDPRQEDGGVPRAAGLNTLYDRPSAIKWVPAACNVIAVELGFVPAGEQRNQIGKREYDVLDAAWQRWSIGRDPKRQEMPDLKTLWERQHYWRGNLTLTTTMSKPVRAALLASTRNFDLNSAFSDLNAVQSELSTDGLPPLDISHWLLGGRLLGGRLSPGQAILICWTPNPGPAQLEVNDRPLPAYDGLTIYRVRVPVHYVGTPPPPAEDVP